MLRAEEKPARRLLLLPDPEQFASPYDDEREHLRDEDVVCYRSTWRNTARLPRREHRRFRKR
jgi:hypothetical protein